MSDRLLIPVSIIIAGALIGGGFYINSKTVGQNTQVSSQKNQIPDSQKIKSTVRPIDENDHILGSSDSRIVMIEYSDTECPFCKNFHSIMLSIMKNYGKDAQVAWVYRHYPIVSIHSKSFKEAEALECAGNLGGGAKFWEYTNKIYEVTPSNNGLDLKQLTEVAKNLGLDPNKFETCLNSGEFAPRVNADINNALELGAKGTPYTIIVDTKNDEYYPIEGLMPYDQIKNVIDIILKS